MAFDPNKFWSDNFYDHPRLTDEMVIEIEKMLGLRLPAEYIDLLRIQNGGYTLGFGHPMSVETTWSENHVPLNDLNGVVLDEDIQTALNLCDNEYLCEEWGLPPRQVLLSGDGHYWITLDYRDSDSPSVSWIDTECDEDIPIAPTFAAFLKGLRPIEEFRDEED